MAGTVATSKLAPSKELAIISGLAKGLSTRKKELEEKELAEQENKIKMADKVISMLKGERAHELDVRKQDEVERSHQATEEIAFKSAQISMENSKASTMKILNDMALSDPENKLAYERATKEIEYDYDIKGYKAKDAVDKRTFGYEQNIQQAGKLEMAGVESELGMKKFVAEQQGRKEIVGIEQAGMSTRLNKSIANQWDIATMNEMGRNDRANLVDARMRDLDKASEGASPLVKSYIDGQKDYMEFIQSVVPDKKGKYNVDDLKLAEQMYDRLMINQGTLLSDPSLTDKQKAVIRGIAQPLKPEVSIEDKGWFRKRTEGSISYSAEEPTIADTGRGLVRSANESTINESAVKIGYTWGKARMDSDGWTLKQVSDALATSKEMTDADRLEAIKRLDKR